MFLFARPGGPFATCIGVEMRGRTVPESRITFVIHTHIEEAASAAHGLVFVRWSRVDNRTPGGLRKQLQLQHCGAGGAELKCRGCRGEFPEEKRM